MPRKSWHEPVVKAPGMRDYLLRSKYGIDSDDYYDILAAQDGLCAICSSDDICKRFLAVDHDHDTGVVRGLLCTKCNVGLGLFGTVENLCNAIAYLQNHKENS